MTSPCSRAAHSITSAKLVPCCAQPLRLNSSVSDPIPYYMLMLDKVRSMAAEFDILHFHIDQFHFPLFHEMARRTVTTLHGRQDLPDLHHLYRGFPDMPLVSISNAQRAPIPDANFVGTVYHGLPRDLSPSRSSRAAAIWPFSAASRPRSASTAPSRSPAPSACR